MPLRDCAEPHCHNDAVLEVCKDVYGDAYAIKPILSMDANGPCKCTCSCMALDTPVADTPTTTRPVQDFKQRDGNTPGDMVLVAGTNLQWHQKEVLFSSGTNRGARQPNAIFIEFGTDEYIVTTGDHLFLMPGGKLRMASRLTTNDKLVRADGSAVAITSVRRGDFHNGFHHISTSRDDPKGKLYDHLLVAAGVVSADDTVQLYKKQFLDAAEEALPEVGSKAYEDKYGAPKRVEPFTMFAGGKVRVGRPGLAALAVDVDSPRMTGAIARVFGGGEVPGRPVFVPAEETRLTIPDDAAS